MIKRTVGDPSSDPISESRVGVRLTASVSENIDRPAGPHVQVELKRVVLGAGAEPPAEQGRYEPGAKTPHRKRKTSQPRKIMLRSCYKEASTERGAP